ncbi:MAG: hypothetical protein ABL995_12645 [Bryobacteraceae bacterium]
MMTKLYAIYGLAVLTTLTMGVYRGWSLTSVDEVKNVPQSVRDNPGSYRSAYSGYRHYTGGK